jgi:hypothetical protein
VRRRSFMAALATFPLGGCQMGADVLVGGEPERPTFAFRRLGLHLDRQLGVLENLTVGGGFENGGYQETWRIVARSLGDVFPVDDVRYGEVPQGAIERAPAAPLRPGMIYRVEVNSRAYVGGAYFAILRDKLVSARGTGDLPLQQVRERVNAGV